MHQRPAEECAPGFVLPTMGLHRRRRGGNYLILLKGLELGFEFAGLFVAEVGIPLERLQYDLIEAHIHLDLAGRRFDGFAGNSPVSIW